MEQWLGKGQNEIPRWVFCNQEGGILDAKNFRNRALHKCLDEAKIRRIRLHDLRHTFASLLIQNGESLAYVKEQMGHSSIKVTVDVYGHLVPGANRQAVNSTALRLINFLMIAEVLVSKSERLGSRVKTLSSNSIS